MKVKVQICKTTRTVQFTTAVIDIEDADANDMQSLEKKIKKAVKKLNKKRLSWSPEKKETNYNNYAWDLIPGDND